jgi:hypothetical protein
MRTLRCHIERIAMLERRSHLLAGGLLWLLPSVAIAQTVPLFDGQGFAGWQMQNGDPVRGGWEVVDGMIHLSTDQGHSGNIITTAEFGDFILDFEWKIEAGGNNGLKYRVRQFGEQWLGYEYQILDDESHENLPAKGSTASLYDIHAPRPDKYLHPPGEFNSSRIVVCGNRLEHWLNGQQVLVAWVGSSQWQQQMAASKFSDVEGFGLNRYGRIMLTDHGSEVWYRNIHMTQLNNCVVQSDTRYEPPQPARRHLLRRLLCRRQWCTLVGR